MKMSENHLNQNSQVDEPELTEEEQAQRLSEVLQIRRDKLSALQQAGRDPFETTVYNRDTLAAQITEHFEEMEGKTVVLAGRMMSCRNMGKA